MLQEEMMCLFVGDPANILQFMPKLKCAVMKLECNVRILYVGRSPFHEEDLTQEENAYETIREDMLCQPLSPSCSDIHRFWQRVRYLYWDLRQMGNEEKVVKMRRLVMHLLSVENHARLKGEVGMIVLDVKGEVVSGRGKGQVEMLCEGREREKELMSEITDGGVDEVLCRSWRDGIIHPNHYPQHLLLPFSDCVDHLMPCHFVMYAIFILRAPSIHALCVKIITCAKHVLSCWGTLVEIRSDGEWK